MKHCTRCLISVSVIEVVRVCVVVQLFLRFGEVHYGTTLTHLSMYSWQSAHWHSQLLREHSALWMLCI